MGVLLRSAVPALLVSLAFPVVFGGGGVEAQSSSRQGLEITREEMQIRVIRGFEHRVRRELGLGEAKMDRIRSIVLEHREARGQLMRDRRALSRDMESFAQTGGSEARARALLGRQLEMQQREVTIQQSEEAALLEVMSAADLVQYLQMRSDLVDRIRELERRGRDGRPGGGPGSR